MAWFRRNKFRLHPSHRKRWAPTGGLKPYCSCTKVHRTFSKDTRDHSRGHGRPRHPNLPYRPFRAHTIAFRYHFPDIMSHNFGSELCIYKSLAYIAEPLEVIVIFALSECVFSKCLTINKIKSSRWAFTPTGCTLIHCISIKCRKRFCVVTKVARLNYPTDLFVWERYTCLRQKYRK